MPDPPRSVCILRLSAIGDACHTLAVVRALQQAWPGTRFTWIIGKPEAKLLGHLPDIEFIAFDKRAGAGAWLQLRRQLRGRRFDVLLHMQLSLRASALAPLIRADIRLGFDRARATELQWLFTNRRIAARSRQHVLDGLFGFAEYFGIPRQAPRWDIPLPEPALEYAHNLIPDGRDTLVISPCSSHPLRNWSAQRYAALGDAAARDHGMQVLVCGGPSALERRYGEDISQHMHEPCINLVGRDTLVQMLATLQRATALLSPDSGPAHMATCVGTPVLGLYAATNPARSGPYLSRQWCVDRYDEAARKFHGKPAAELPWTTKIEREGVMDLVTVEEVRRKLDELMATHATTTASAPIPAAIMPP